MDVPSIIWAIIMGMVNGIIVATLGYLKGTELEKIDNYKLFQTVIIGAIIGIITGYFGWDYTTALDWAATIGVIGAVDQLCKLIWRRTNGFGTRTKEQAEQDTKAIKGRKKVKPDTVEPVDTEVKEDKEEE